MKLDVLDKKILALLDIDARMSTSDIARKVRHGRDIVHYRVERIFREEVLMGSQAIINPYCLGFTLYKTYMRLKNDKKRMQLLHSRLKKDPNIFCVALCDGAWDIVFNTLARNPAQFDRIQNSLLTDYQDLIIEFEFAVIIEQALSPRGYFGGKDSRTFFLGGEPQEQEIDALQLTILDLLAKDARLSVTELARRSDSSPAAVQNRIDRMERSGLIIGYRGVPNLPALGLTNFKTQVYLRSFAPAEVHRLKQFASQHPSIVKVITQLGNCKLELGIEAQSYEHFHIIAQELRATFPDLIVNISTILIREETYRWISGKIEITQLSPSVSTQILAA